MHQSDKKRETEKENKKVRAVCFKIELKVDWMWVKYILFAFQQFYRRWSSSRLGLQRVNWFFSLHHEEIYRRLFLRFVVFVNGCSMLIKAVNIRIWKSFSKYFLVSLNLFHFQFLTNMTTIDSWPTLLSFPHWFNSARV